MYIYLEGLVKWMDKNGTDVLKSYFYLSVCLQNNHTGKIR